MGDLLTRLLPLSLGAAISPTVLAVALTVLSGRRAVARGAAYAAGVLLVLGGLTAIGLYGVRRTAPSAITTEIGHVVDGIAGVLLLLLAIGTILRGALHDPAAPDPDTTPPPKHQPGLRGAFVLGLAMMLANFSTILLYLPAMHAISAADLATGDTIVAVAIAFVITSTPATAPYLFRVVAPGPAGRVFGRLHEIVARNQRRIAIAIEVRLSRGEGAPLSDAHADHSRDG